MPSSDSRPAAVRGSTLVTGTGAAAASGSAETPPAAGLISVSPANSLTGPVTCTWSPIEGYDVAPVPR